MNKFTSFLVIAACTGLVTVGGLILTQSVVSIPFTGRHLEFRIDTSVDTFARKVMAERFFPTIKYNPNISIDVVEYASSIDGVGPLYTNVVFDPYVKKQPVLVYMHGYYGNRSRGLFEEARIAEQGVFVIAPDMRGRGVKTNVKRYRDSPPERPYPAMRFQADMTNFLRDLDIPREYLTKFTVNEIHAQVREVGWRWFNEMSKVEGFLPPRFNDRLVASAGDADDGGVEIYDIIDAIRAAASKYGEYMDINDVSIMGISGGGGSVFSAITKFPDTFKHAASFFGISDYEYWFYNANTSHRPIFRELMRKNIGGSPDEVPSRYKARNSLLGVINNPYTNINLYWDEHEVQCPGYFNTEYGRRAKRLGYDNVTLHETTFQTYLRGEGRARHIWTYEKSLQFLIDKYVEKIKARKQVVKPVLDTKGEAVVLGYLKTKKFFIMWNDGRDTVSKLNYDVEIKGDGTFQFAFKKMSGPQQVSGQITVFDAEGAVRVTENGKEFGGWAQEGRNLVLTRVEPDNTYKIHFR